ncbi:MAG: type IV secretion protein IcmD [Pseudomonadota bacterium]
MKSTHETQGKAGGRLKSTLTGLGLLMLSGACLASGSQDLQTLSNNITSNLNAIAQLITAGSYVAGVGFALAGMVKFKAHRDAPTQTPLSAPLVMLAVAAGLVFLPSVIGSTGQTIFKGGTVGGPTGQGLSSLGG